MHPSIQSAGSLITSAAAQLMTLVRPAPLVVFDAVMQVNQVIPATTTLYLRYGHDQVSRFNCNTHCCEYACCRDPSRCRSRGSI